MTAPATLLAVVSKSHGAARRCPRAEPAITAITSAVNCLFSRRAAESAETEYAYEYDEIGNWLTSLDLGTNRAQRGSELVDAVALIQ